MSKFYFIKNFHRPLWVQILFKDLYTYWFRNYYEMINLNENKYPKWWLKIHNDIKKEIKDIDKHASYHAHGLSDGPKKTRVF